MWIIRTAVVLCVLLAGSGCAHARGGEAARVLTTASASGPCTWQRESGNPNARYLGTPPPTGGDHLGVHTMTITTNLGAITVRLDPADAPCTVASFAYLAAFAQSAGLTLVTFYTGFGQNAGLSLLVLK